LYAFTALASSFLLLWMFFHACDDVIFDHRSSPATASSNPFVSDKMCKRNTTIHSR
jgi:hypothetical protein